ncbi:MAG: hypothetical protein K2K57_00035 [Oscillospiraceae bacterium]|nr:hypothetical protein [Oscillospiraceae bacterium]
MTQFDVFDNVLNRVRKRPGMYFGSNSIKAFNSFWDGYVMALSEYKIIEWEKEKFAADTPLPLWFFNEFAAKKFGYRESTAGWARIIADNVGDGNMESWNAFLDIFDEFAVLRIVGCKMAVLSDENIRFCNERPVRVFRMRKGVFREGREYEFPERVFILTLTNGWEMVLVECAESITAYMHFLDSGGAAAVIEELFGDVEGFSELDIEKLLCEKELLI